MLPLQNLSGDPEQEYFADGLTGALIISLSKIRALRVVSRTTAMSYKGVLRPVPEIGRELGVDAVVRKDARTALSRDWPSGVTTSSRKPGASTGRKKGDEA